MYREYYMANYMRGVTAYMQKHIAVDASENLRGFDGPSSEGGDTAAQAV